MVGEGLSTNGESGGSPEGSGWLKSPFCTSANCVLVNYDGNNVQVAGGQVNNEGGFMTFTNEEWAAFIQGAEAGNFSLKALKANYTARQAVIEQL